MADRLPEGDRPEVLGVPTFVMPTREHPALTAEGIPFYVILHKGEEIQIGDTVEIIPCNPEPRQRNTSETEASGNG